MHSDQHLDLGVCLRDGILTEGGAKDKYLCVMCLVWCQGERDALEHVAQADHVEVTCRAAISNPSNIVRLQRHLPAPVIQAIASRDVRTRAHALWCCRCDVTVPSVTQLLQHLCTRTHAISKEASDKTREPRRVDGPRESTLAPQALPGPVPAPRLSKNASALPRSSSNNIPPPTPNITHPSRIDHHPCVTSSQFHNNESSSTLSLSYSSGPIGPPESFQQATSSCHTNIDGTGMLSAHHSFITAKNDVDSGPTDLSSSPTTHDLSNIFRSQRFSHNIAPPQGHPYKTVPLQRAPSKDAVSQNGASNTDILQPEDPRAASSEYGGTALLQHDGISGTVSTQHSVISNTVTQFQRSIHTSRENTNLVSSLRQPPYTPLPQYDPSDTSEPLLPSCTASLPPKASTSTISPPEPSIFTASPDNLSKISSTHSISHDAGDPQEVSHVPSNTYLSTSSPSSPFSRRTTPTPSPPSSPTSESVSPCISSSPSPTPLPHSLIFPSPSLHVAPSSSPPSAYHSSPSPSPPPPPIPPKTLNPHPTSPLAPPSAPLRAPSPPLPPPPSPPQVPSLPPPEMTTVSPILSPPQPQHPVSSTNDVPETLSLLPQMETQDLSPEPSTSTTAPSHHQINDSSNNPPLKPSSNDDHSQFSEHVLQRSSAFSKEPPSSSSSSSSIQFPSQSHPLPSASPTQLYSSNDLLQRSTSLTTTDTTFHHSYSVDSSTWSSPSSGSAILVPKAELTNASLTATSDPRNTSAYTVISVSTATTTITATSTANRTHSSSCSLDTDHVHGQHQPSHRVHSIQQQSQQQLQPLQHSYSQQQHLNPLHYTHPRQQQLQPEEHLEEQPAQKKQQPPHQHPQQIHLQPVKQQEQIQPSQQQLQPPQPAYPQQQYLQPAKQSPQRQLQSQPPPPQQLEPQHQQEQIYPVPQHSHPQPQLPQPPTDQLQLSLKSQRPPQTQSPQPKPRQRPPKFPPQLPEEACSLEAPHLPHQTQLSKKLQPLPQHRQLHQQPQQQELPQKQLVQQKQKQLMQRQKQQQIRGEQQQGMLQPEIQQQQQQQHMQIQQTQTLLELLPPMPRGEPKSLPEHSLTDKQAPPSAPSLSSPTLTKHPPQFLPGLTTPPPTSITSTLNQNSTQAEPSMYDCALQLSSRDQSHPSSPSNKMGATHCTLSEQRHSPSDPTHVFEGLEDRHLKPCPSSEVPINRRPNDPADLGGPTRPSAALPHPMEIAQPRTIYPDHKMAPPEQVLQQSISEGVLMVLGKGAFQCRYCNLALRNLEEAVQHLISETHTAKQRQAAFKQRINRLITPQNWAARHSAAPLRNPIGYRPCRPPQHALRPVLRQPRPTYRTSEPLQEENAQAVGRPMISRESGKSLQGQQDQKDTPKTKNEQRETKELSLVEVQQREEINEGQDDEPVVLRRHHEALDNDPKALQRRHFSLQAYPPLRRQQAFIRKRPVSLQQEVEEEQERGPHHPLQKSQSSDPSKGPTEYEKPPLISKFLKVRSSVHLVGPSAGVYRNLSNPRGLVFIFIYRKYASGRLTERRGSGHDVKNLRCLFVQMGYSVHAYEDLTGWGTLAQVREIQERRDLWAVDSFIIILLGQGASAGTFYASDMRRVPLDDVRLEFSEGRCPALKDKPKIILANFFHGNVEEVLSSPSTTPKDMLTLHASIAGVRPRGHPLESTIFVQILSEVLATESWDTPLEELCFEVCRRVQACGGTACLERNRDFKEFYFNP